MTVSVIDDDLLEATLQKARASARRRINHNFHTGPEDNPHRFLNAMLRGTYVHPHRHLAPPKAESFIVLAGELSVFVFDDEGAPTGRYDLSTGRGIDLSPGVWHSLVVRSEEAVVYEVKPGPWDPATDKEMAPWAPAEGSPDCPAFIARLLRFSESPSATS